MIPAPRRARALLVIAAGLAELARILTRRPVIATRTLATIGLGDTLLLPDGRHLGVTGLIPAHADDAVAYGARQVFSGSWSMTLEPGDVVTVQPRVTAGGGPELDSCARWEYELERTR